MTSSTKFALGSIGKSITATAIGLHMERAQDNITYDTTIASLIHPWRFSDDEELNRYANLRDILSHRTAQPSHDGSLFMGNERTREDILREIHRLPTIASVTKSNVSQFRQSFNYNNDMFSLAAALLERREGKRFESIVDELIFQPNQMHDAKYLSDCADDEANVALSHYAVSSDDGTTSNRSFVMRPRPMRDFRQMIGTDGTYNGPGGVMASANDMRQYLLLWVNANASTIGRLAYQELMRPQTALEVPADNFLSPPRYSYRDSLDTYTANALFAGTHRGRRRFQHGGNLGSFASLVDFHPSERIGVYVSASGATIGTLSSQLFIQSALELLYRDDGEFVEWGPEKVCFPFSIDELKLDLKPLPQHPLTNRSRYQGLYKHPLVGHVRIEAHPYAQWQLTMRCGSMGDAVLALDSEQSDTLFRVRFTGALAYLHEQIGGPIPPEARLVEFERGAATNSMQAVRLGFILLANWKPLAFHEQALFERVQ